MTSSNVFPGSSSAVDLASLRPVEGPPTIDGPNPMPLDWADRVPRMRELYDKATSSHYNPMTELPWDSLRPGDFTPDERIALAYWFSVDGSFENSGVPTFAEAMIASREGHYGDDVSRVLLTIARDEAHHDDICKRAAQTLVPGFPFNWQPTNDLGKMAVANLRWISFINSRYWTGYKKAFQKRRFSAITTAFIMGEAAASLIFRRSGELSEHPLFGEAFRLIGRDEARHFAFCNHLGAKEFSSFTDEEKETMTKNIRASFIYVSLILDTPRLPFWDAPDGFAQAHLALEDLASRAGLGLPDLDERQELWQKAALRTKDITDPAGIVFPAMPEVGISGQETPLTEEDFVVMSF